MLRTRTFPDDGGAGYDLRWGARGTAHGTAALAIDTIIVDAGTRHLRLQACSRAGDVLHDVVVASDADPRSALAGFAPGLQPGARGATPVVATGKLAPAVLGRLGGGKRILPAAAYWLAAHGLVGRPENAGVDSLAMVDLSASGYLIIGIDRSGALRDDLLVMNPRCGAGSGINLDRVLQKLAVAHEAVDPLLARYLGEAGRELRDQAAVRVDRCGVFSTSATISDKNQGIPLQAALATTLKSEVLKTVKKLPAGFDKVYFSGGIFRWQYARDCAEDLLRAQGVTQVGYDPGNDAVLEALRALVAEVGAGNLAQPDARLGRADSLEQHPSFTELKARYESSATYRCMPATAVSGCSVENIEGRELILALDVGSTMAKVVLADADSEEILFLDAYSNAGDTIETVKKVFADLVHAGIEALPLRSVGITGSARYQVQQAMSRIYPGLSGRVSVLVENYAHARGSIDQARRHIEWLRERGAGDVNEDLCILVDIGGEDTKLSTIALREEELFDNAMNTKCSAGTGSLMDTLSAMFGVPSVEQAQARAYGAARSFAINATCAVFLMENASKLQAQGTPRDEILASANWAIVENMARSLWRQLELPAHAVVLLHGQTMLSHPLPLAVTHRLRAFLGTEVYALVPPHPGHRACIGLVRTLCRTEARGVERIALKDLLDASFERRVIQCKGAVCGDPMAHCNRCALRWQADDGRKVAFTVGGCTAINEVISSKGRKNAAQPRDAYKEIWDFIDARHPRSDAPERLVIPRSFAVSEWAYFLARIFTRLGIPVHVDNVRDTDLSDAQPGFNVDVCAPQMGAVGQYRRLAGAAHGVILAPQIESLPTDGASSGLTCTTNQGGVAVARNLAEMTHPDARFHLFSFRIDRLDAGELCDRLFSAFEPVLLRYGVACDRAGLEAVIDGALADHLALRREAADLAAGIAEQALDEGRQVALVVGREYVLTPGIYDSNIRRLLRDRQMTVIPSYVLDVDLDPDYAEIYWRNPHTILSVLKAVAHRTLHQRLRHPRLRAVFRRIETDGAHGMLPVVQVSTFSCGPDSVIAHYVAEIMKARPFLLIQSDAVLKELAHLENRVNTYVKQLEQGLHARLAVTGEGSFEIRRLDDLVSHEPLDPETDVLCLPTLDDNRAVTAVLRAAGYTCMQNYDESAYDLRALVTSGRKAAGEAVCAPLAAIYADLERCVDEFARRKRDGDPELAGKRRLVLIDSHGPGPCRQGQYPGLHRLFFHRSACDGRGAGDPGSMPGDSLFRFMVVDESDGYRGGFDEWVILRIYQGLILKGILQSILFNGAAGCADHAEYERFMTDYRALRAEVYHALESFTGPGRLGRSMLRWLDGRGWAGVALKYFLYELHGRSFARPIARFVRAWIEPRRARGDELEIRVSGEGYMRLAQCEEIFRVLLGELGFRRFHLEVAPVLSYLECLLEEALERRRTALRLEGARRSRTAHAGVPGEASGARQHGRGLGTIKLYRFALRHLVARPLYKAAGLRLPLSAQETVEAARELLPTYRPYGELAPYVGEALLELRHGADLILNVAPTGCMVSSMGEVLTPGIMHGAGVHSGRIQTLMSADGEVDDEVLTLAVLKATGPRRYYQTGCRTPPPRASRAARGRRR